MKWIQQHPVLTAVLMLAVLMAVCWLGAAAAYPGGL